MKSGLVFVAQRRNPVECGVPNGGGVSPQAPSGVERREWATGATAVCQDASIEHATDDSHALTLLDFRGSRSPDFANLSAGFAQALPAVGWSGLMEGRGLRCTVPWRAGIKSA